MYIHIKNLNFNVFLTCLDSSDSDYSHLYGRGAPGLAGNSRAGTNVRKFPAKPLFMRYNFKHYLIQKKSINRPGLKLRGVKLLMSAGHIGPLCEPRGSNCGQKMII